MRYRHYVPYGLTGTGLWAAAFCLLGYFLSEHVNEAVHIAGRAGFWLGVAAAVVVGAILGVRYLRRAGEREVLRAGLAATAVAAACGIAATIALALVVGSHSGPTGIDSSAFDAARDVRATWLTDVAKVVTYLGSVVVTLPVALVAAVVLAVRRRWWELAVLALVHSGVVLVALLALSDEGAPSYDHETAAALAGLGVLVVLVIGLTRVYLRAHFFTDVLGGWALGLAAFAIPTGVAIFLAIARVGNNQGDAAR
jgi:undecaprenyl-diphosphatase